MGVLSICGGAVGSFFLVHQFLSQPFSIIQTLILTIYVLIACFGIVAGVLLLEGDPRARMPSLVFWGYQVPLFFLPGLGHQLGFGAYAFVVLLFPLELKAFAGAGTQFAVRFMQLGPNSIGVNVLALIVVLWLARTLPVEEEISKPPGEHAALLSSAAENTDADSAGDVI